MIVCHLSSRDSQIYSKIMFTHNTSALKVCPNFWHAFFSFFLYSPSFSIKMHAMDAKTQKIEPDPLFFWTDKSFGGSMQTWLTEHEVVFIF